MNSKIGEFVQMLTGIGVLVGLFLVILELKQSREATEAQLKSEGTVILASQRIAQMGENPSATIAKACEQPWSLDLHDMFVMEAYLM